MDVLFIVFVLVLSGSLAAQEQQIDGQSGMIIDDNWQVVKAHCTVCHSARQVTQQRGSRETWLNLIRWMQDKQGLWQFDSATENGILDYLEKNYAPAASYRRTPLAPELMPAPLAEATG